MFQQERNESAEKRIDPRDVVLVSLPWAPPTEPSLGLGILQSCLINAGFSAHCLYAAPRLLATLSPKTYEYLANTWGIADFLFTAVLDPLCDDNQLTKVLSIAKFCVDRRPNSMYSTVETLCKLFMHVRHDIMPTFLEKIVDEIIACRPKLVGFTCMFDQTIASVAAAKLLRERDDEIAIVFGGYALYGAPGRTVGEAFPWIDYIVQGDGEIAIVELAKRIIMPTSAKEKPFERFITGAPVPLSESPMPDYSSWFEETRKLALTEGIQINTGIIPVESSRGCWWGQSNHCVFCGIDEESLKYRSKTSDQTIEMLSEMRERYGDHIYRFSDYILPTTFYKTLLPALAEIEPKFRLNAEIKANQTPERLSLFANAGFVELQPGVESFSSKVLRSMDKGLRSIDNVALLLGTYLNRIIINYNILYGLPDDSIEDYLRMLEMIPRMYHLSPPITRTETVVTRFAPLQADPGRFGISKKAVHHSSYETLFSSKFLGQTNFNLDDYAYYFERNFEYKEELCQIYFLLVGVIDHWKSLHRNRFVELSIAHMDNRSIIVDTRFPNAASYELSKIESSVYAAMDLTIARISAVIQETISELGCSAKEVKDAIEELDARRLLWIEGDLAIGLAIPKDVCQAHKDSQWVKSWYSPYV